MLNLATASHYSHRGFLQKAERVIDQRDQIVERLLDSVQ
jgi:hypothetical protein